MASVAHLSTRAPLRSALFTATKSSLISAVEDAIVAHAPSHLGACQPLATSPTRKGTLHEGRRIRVYGITPHHPATLGERHSGGLSARAAVGVRLRPC